MKRTFSKIIQTVEGERRVDVEIGHPSVPGTRFLEHRFNRVTRESEDDILACNGSLLVHSNDGGGSWKSKKIGGIDTIRNAFTSSDGTIIIAGTDEEDLTKSRIAVIEKGKIVSSEIVGYHGWHGTFAIDENEDCIMFSEYPNNVASSPHNTPETCAHVHRTRDGGLTWEVVFTVEYPEIRHFHTCTAVPGTGCEWLITSGDEPSQSRFWLSEDNGDSWTEVTDSEAKVDTTPGCELLAHRTVVMLIDDESYIWATDDPVGDMDGFDSGYEIIEWPIVEGASGYRVVIRDYSDRGIVAKVELPADQKTFLFDWNEHEIDHDYRYRIQYRIKEEDEWEDTGMYTVISRKYNYHPNEKKSDEITRSRLVRSSRDNSFSLEVLCELGMHIRSMVDVGEGYLMISEAKFLEKCPCPQVFLVLKNDLGTCHHLFNLPNPHKLKTGVTYSRSSISANKGVFFTQMQKGILSDQSEMAMWEISISETE